MCGLLVHGLAGGSAVLLRQLVGRLRLRREMAYVRTSSSLWSTLPQFGPRESTHAQRRRCVLLPIVASLFPACVVRQSVSVEGQVDRRG